jgi:hypothetical protein
MASALCGSTPVVSLGHTHTLKGAVFVVRPSRTGGEQSVEDFQQIKALLVSEAVRSPIVENQQQTDDKAQDARWRHIQKTLNVDCLRAYLKRLPDFEDFEAERKALVWAAEFGSAERALAFFVAWPNLEHAARLVRDRIAELDGRVYYALRPAAEAIEDRYMEPPSSRCARLSRQTHSTSRSEPPPTPGWEIRRTDAFDDVRKTDPNLSVNQIAAAGPDQIGHWPIVGPQARNGGLCSRSGGLVPPDAV